METLLAAAITAVLLLAAQSAIMLASHAVPDAKSKATALVSASNGLDQLNADLSFATAFTSRSATAVTFQVPDRTGDGVAETITWSWSGQAGSPLVRTMNAGKPQTILPSVQSFSMSYDMRTVTAPQTYSTGAETLLASSDIGLLTTANRINNSSTVGQYFKPTLPSSASSWSVTRVQLKSRYHGAAQGQALVQLGLVNGSGTPTGVIVDQATQNEAALTSSFAWQTYNYTSATGLDPTLGLAILLKWVSDSDACDIESATVALALANSNMLTSTTGATWSASLLGDLNYYVYGTISTPDAPSSLYYLTGVRAVARTTNDTQATARQTIRVLNEPQVGGP